MDGLPLDVILLASIGLVAAVSLAVYISRKAANEQEGGATEGATGGGGDASPGRLARHPGGECPICLSVEVETPVQTNCGHWYCARCILSYYDGVGRVRIKCPLCRQEVTMLHRAAEDVPATPAAPAHTAPVAAKAAAAAAAETAEGQVDAAATAPPAATPAPPLASPEIQEQIARFNERSTRRRRSPWQVVEDAPLLLRRLWADLRRGDTQVFSELLRRGVQLQFLGVVLYVLIPVDIMPEGLLGVAGLVDDLIVVVILLLHITTVYRTILLAWERSRAPQTAAAAAAAAAAPATATTADAPGTGDTPPSTAAAAAAAAAGMSGEESLGSPHMGPGVAAVSAVAAGTIATFAGADSGVAAFAAVATGVVAAAAVGSSSNVREMQVPPLAGDW